MLTLALLLRGINVGKAKQVPMADLKAVLEEGGYEDVRTLLRSGNVALAAPSRRSADAVARDAEKLIAHRFGFDVDVVARTGAELAEILDTDPFDGAADDGARRLVAFLGTDPNESPLHALTSADFGEERIAVGPSGRELHLWCPRGQADSELTKALGRAKLGTVVTVRNWNTTVKLAALVDATAASS